VFLQLLSTKPKVKEQVIDKAYENNSNMDYIYSLQYSEEKGHQSFRLDPRLY